MPDYLIFQLYGQMAAWGDIAVGETRRSALQPSKSALLGIVGASLGIDRNEEEIHAAMASAYGLALKLFQQAHCWWITIPSRSHHKNAMSFLQHARKNWPRINWERSYQAGNIDVMPRM